jgi:hypothetical protein
VRNRIPLGQKSAPISFKKIFFKKFFKIKKKKERKKKEKTKEKERDPKDKCAVKRKNNGAVRCIA